MRKTATIPAMNLLEGLMAPAGHDRMGGSWKRAGICLFLACFSCQLLAAQGRRPPVARSSKNRHWQQIEWFHRQRSYPLGFIPAGVRRRAIDQVKRMREQEAEKLSLSPPPSGGPKGVLASPDHWTLIGPQPTNTPYGYPTSSGRVTALAVDPGNSNIVYLGGAQGGVWKTSDGGAHWTPLTDDQPSLAVGSIGLDPSNSSIVYVGTGEENFSGDSYYGAGILKSTNGGADWTQLGAAYFAGPSGSNSYFGGGKIGAIAVSPSNGQIVLAAVMVYSDSSQPGIYRSTDGGSTWTNVLPGAPGTAAFFDPTNGNIAYAALGDTGGSASNGVYKSINGGANWARSDASGVNKLPTTNVGRIALTLAPSSTSTLFAGIANYNDGSLLGLYKSTDGGVNWSQINSIPDYCTNQCWYDNVLAVDPANASVVFAGGSAQNGTLFRTVDGGTNWAEISSGANGVNLHVDQHALAFASTGARLYVGNDGGAWSTTDVTNTTVNWTNLNATLAVTQFYPGFSIHPTNVNTAFGGTQDNGTEKYSGALAWDNVTCGDGGWTAIDTTTPATIYAACQYIQILKSTSGGGFGTWLPAQTGIDISDPTLFIPPLVIDALTPTRLYFGTYRIWQTTNGAGSWTVISGDLTTGIGFISAITVAPGDSNTVYVGTDDGKVGVTTNAGDGVSAIWSDISAGLPNRSVTQVSVDPANSQVAYVTFSGFSGFGGDTQGHVFKTTNGGGIWTDISGNLPNIPANDVVVDPDISNTFYVATDVGVFRTINGGTTWSTLVTGLPNVAVLGLKLHEPSRTLRAATHGRSAWDLSLSSTNKQRRGQLTSE